MPATPTSVLDDRFSLGLLLILVMLFSWLTGLKNLVSEWSTTAEQSTDAEVPNILMIVADDLGYDDTNAINPGGLSTPHITQLAQGGVIFTRHYADSTCTPSRVAMLTGRDAERSGFRPVGPEIPGEFATIAEQLRAAGYATHLTGKWHAGEDRAQARPEHKGFDRWFGFLNQWETAGEISDASMGVRKPTYHNPMLRADGGALSHYEGHLTDILTEHSIARLNELQSADKPWFLYHAFLAPHHPIQPAQRYRERFPDTPEGRYTALVTQLDDAIGRLLQAVDRSNTLVIFVSDNGGTNRERNNNFPFYGRKGDIHEGAYRTPLILNWPGVVPQGKVIDDIVMNVDIYPTLLASAHRPAPTDLDGNNLWPLIHNDAPHASRERGWEVYNANVNTLAFSFLTRSGELRLASQGLQPALFDLSIDPSGERDSAAEHSSQVEELEQDFWREHWRKSVVPAAAQPGNREGQTLYSGFDAMRTPHRYGFATGLEIGPLPTSITQAQSEVVLASQEAVWELRYKPGEGIQWRLGDTVLEDPHFDPLSCNAIVMTGYFRPKGHLAKREPRSHLKLYSSGFLRDAVYDVHYAPADNKAIDAPTAVNFHGRAIFSNMMLSSFADSYSPQTGPQFVDIYNSLYKDEKLSIAGVGLMNRQLCH